MLSAVVAVAVGFALGWVTKRLMDVLGDATLQIGLTLLVPFVSYVLAEELKGSGVLAVLTTALYLAEYTHDPDDVLGRLAGHTFWEVVDTLVTGVAFGLVGLELHTAVSTASGRWGEMLGIGGIVVAVVIGVRLLWLLPAAWLTRKLHKRRDVHEEILMSWRETVVTWWSGMRGVATVALALAIPLTKEDKSPFPARGEILFIAFAVILVTLVAQGLTLPRLVRALGVGADKDESREMERQLAARAAKAARHRLMEIVEAEDLSEDMMEMLGRRAFDIGARISPEMVDEERREAHEQRVERLRTLHRVQAELLSAARREVIAARSEPGTDPEVADKVLRHLDERTLRGI